MQMIPRCVVFGPDNKAICSGNACHVTEGRKVTMFLPTAHYDFPGPVELTIKGKTEQEILTEVEKYR